MLVSNSLDVCIVSVEVLSRNREVLAVIHLRMEQQNVFVDANGKIFKNNIVVCLSVIN